MGPTQKKKFVKAPFVAAGGLALATPVLKKALLDTIVADVNADVLVIKTAAAAAKALAVSDAAALAVTTATNAAAPQPEIDALQVIADAKLALSTAANTAAAAAVTAAGTAQAAVETPTAANTANMSLAELETHAGVHSLVEGVDYDSNADLIDLNYEGVGGLEEYAAATVPATNDTIRPKQALVDAIRKAQLVAAINAAEGD